MLARTPQKMHTATCTSAIGVTQPSQRKMRSLVLLARNLPRMHTTTSTYAIGVRSACALDKLDARIGWWSGTAHAKSALDAWPLL